MRGFLTFLIVIFISISCSTNFEDSTNLEATEFLPQASKDYDYDTEEEALEVEETDSLKEVLLSHFPELDFTENSFTEKNTLYLPNRLGYQEKSEYYFSIDSIPHHLIIWQFNDSSKSINAFYNWLDCFGNDCLSIRINEEKNSSKDAFIIWQDNFQIAFLESEKNLNPKTWESILGNTENSENQLNFLLQQNRHGKIKWILSPFNNETIKE